MADDEVAASEVEKIKNMKVIKHTFLAESSGVKHLITLGPLCV